MSKAVELSIRGQRCRVVTSATEEELKALTDMVESKLAGVLRPGTPLTTQAMILAAVALANDVVEQKQRADAVAEAAVGSLRGLLARVDDALTEEIPVAADKQRRGARSKQVSTRHAARIVADAVPLADAVPTAAQAHHQQAGEPRKKP